MPSWLEFLGIFDQPLQVGRDYPTMRKAERDASNARKAREAEDHRQGYLHSGTVDHTKSWHYQSGQQVREEAEHE